MPDGWPARQPRPRCKAACPRSVFRPILRRSERGCDEWRRLRGRVQQPGTGARAPWPDRRLVGRCSRLQGAAAIGCNTRHRVRPLGAAAIRPVWRWRWPDRAVRPWRLLAGPRPQLFQPPRTRTERPRRHGGTSFVRSVSGCACGDDRRPDPGGLRPSVAALRKADGGRRAFGRRASGRLHAGDRLEHRGRRPAGSPYAGRLFAVGAVRPRAAGRDKHQRRAGCHRCAGRRRADWCSTRWWAERRAKNICASRAPLRQHGARPGCGHAARWSRAPTTSPWWRRWLIPTAP